MVSKRNGQRQEREKKKSENQERNTYGFLIDFFLFLISLSAEAVFGDRATAQSNPKRENSKTERYEHYGSQPVVVVNLQVRPKL